MLGRFLIFARLQSQSGNMAARGICFMSVLTRTFVCLVFCTLDRSVEEILKHIPH